MVRRCLHFFEPRYAGASRRWRIPHTAVTTADYRRRRFPGKRGLLRGFAKPRTAIPWARRMARDRSHARPMPLAARTRYEPHGTRGVKPPRYSPLMGNAVFMVFGSVGIICRGSRPVRVSRKATISTHLGPGKRLVELHAGHDTRRPRQGLDQAVMEIRRFERHIPPRGHHPHMLVCWLVRHLITPQMRHEWYSATYLLWV